MIQVLTCLLLFFIVSPAYAGALPDSLRKRLVFEYVLEYDQDWGPAANRLEYTIVLAAGGNERAKTMAQKALDAQHAWNTPDGLRLFAMAYSLWKRPEDLKAAREIYHVVGSSLNAAGVEAAVALSMASNDEAILKKAKSAASAMSRQHGQSVEDVLKAGRAHLALYVATADRSYLSQARQAAEFIETNFKEPTGGYRSNLISREVNVSLSRFLHLLSDFTGNEVYREMSGHAMQYVLIPEVAVVKPTADVLLAELEWNKDPLHLVVVGSKKDVLAKQMYAIARTAFPLLTKRLEWLDRAEGPLPNSDVIFPELPKAAAFLCADGRCSLPIFTVERLQSRLVGSY